MNESWTVWVGGVEVNDCYLSEQEARLLAKEWTDRGYDDVAIENIDGD